MTKITKSIEIEASPEKVFAFVISNKMNDVWKDLYEATWTSEGPIGVGSTSHFVGHPDFIKGEWDMEVTEFEKNKNMTMHTKGKSPMKATVSMILEPTTKGTNVTYVEDYQMPYSIFGKMIDIAKVRKGMEKAHIELLENLRKALEA